MKHFVFLTASVGLVAQTPYLNYPPSGARRIWCLG